MTILLITRDPSDSEHLAFNDNKSRTPLCLHAKAERTLSKDLSSKSYRILECSELRTMLSSRGYLNVRHFPKRRIIVRLRALDNNGSTKLSVRSDKLRNNAELIVLSIVRSPSDFRGTSIPGIKQSTTWRIRMRSIS